MKNILIGAIFFPIIIASCSKMDAYKERFQKGKELSYPGILDSAQILPGNKRVMLTGLFLSDPKIVKYRIYWNGGLDSMDKSIIRSAGIDTVRQIISNLPEGNSSFGVRTFDIEGNESILVSVSGNIYGDNYQSGIINRGYTSATEISPSELAIEWLSVDPSLILTQLTYTATDNSIKQFTIFNAKAHIDTLSDYKPGTNVLVQSRYLPEPIAIDTFTVLKADTVQVQ